MHHLSPPVDTTYLTFICVWSSIFPGSCCAPDNRLPGYLQIGMCASWGECLDVICQGGEVLASIQVLHECVMYSLHKPILCKIFRFKKHFFLHFLSFLDTEVMQVVEIFPCGRQGAFNTLRPRQNARHFGKWHFQMHFIEWKCMYLAFMYHLMECLGTSYCINTCHQLMTIL